MRILLVEDDHMLGAATREALRDATHAVDWVLDGASALSAAQGGEYELMLLDLGLPKRDGLSVLQALRQSGSNLPILILTARDALEDRVRGLDLGADDYLVKPFESAELLARIRAWRGARADRRSLCCPTVCSNSTPFPARCGFRGRRSV
jgi:two component transcriptional regulator, winged helix family